MARWTLYFFGACFVGGILGFLVAKVSSLELGMGVGPLIPGIVSLSFTVAFFREYRDLSFNPSRAPGTVGAIEDRADNAAGNVTTPVAIIEYAMSDGCKRRASSRGATSFKVDDRVVPISRRRRIS